MEREPKDVDDTSTDTRDTRPGEDDVDQDALSALSRATGGGESTEGDAASTTGTGPSDVFVGRVAGQDVGYAGETGAERRAAAGETGPA